MSNPDVTGYRPLRTEGPSHAVGNPPAPEQEAVLNGPANLNAPYAAPIYGNMKEKQELHDAIAALEIATDVDFALQNDRTLPYVDLAKTSFAAPPTQAGEQPTTSN
jgi:hypothetical protein